MASIRKHPNSRYWIAIFRDSNGKQTTRSTKLLCTPRNRKEAKRKAEEWEQMFREVKTREQALKVTNDIAGRILGEKMRVGVATFSVRWQSWQEAKIAANTRRKYRDRLADFVSWLPEDACVQDVTHGTMQDYHAHLMKNGRTVSTANQALRILRKFFAAAIKESLIAKNPTDDMDIKRVPAEKPRDQFTFEEIRRLMDHADPEWQGMIRLGLYTAQRIGDLAMIEWSSFDLEAGILSFVPAKTKRTGKTLRVPLAAPLLEWLREYRNTTGGEGPLFPRFQKYKTHVNLSHVSREFRQIMKDADVRKTFHCLRHTTPSLLAAAGVPIQTVMMITGHQSEDIAMNYTHQSDAQAKEAMRKIDNLVI